ncbi:PecA family PE domain-processing aspartic protease [Mycobacterium sp. 1081908.1]|uniref:PecA family PE domain-processing aspartic protease n=1 Tax=Mycobacterium sp. 1081908.1 TaxID=1834066 RepID=UPI001E507D5F|nr:PecA family PE domain-processing aspartic protease [Mycobacterium sp. 1081908.1]
MASIGSTVSAAQAAAAAPTTGVLAAAGDEVSTAIAAMFSQYASAYQALSAQAGAFHAQFVQALNAGAGGYAATEAANATPLETLQQDLLAVINAPTDTLLGRPLIGNGANGITTAQGVGTPGGPGGILVGNGGNGGNSTATGAPGGAGGPAGLLLGNGGTGGTGGPAALGGAGGRGGLLWGAAGAAGAPGPATVPIQLQGQDLYASVSVGGGPTVSAILDTGSRGLILPPQDVNTQSLGAVTGQGSVTYGEPGNQLIENFKTYSTTVNFGNGIVTTPTTVAVVTSATLNGVAYSTAQLPAILGVGVNPGGPLSTSPVTALPGAFGQGVLIDEPAGVMEFGPNPLPAHASVTGAPVTTLAVRINNGALQTTNFAYIDSGGLGGDVPTALNPPNVGGYLPAGTTISVYTTGGTLLYTTTVGAQQTAVVSSFLGGTFNTGIAPFLQNPIYLSYSPSGTGTTIFDT